MSYKPEFTLASPWLMTGNQVFYGLMVNVFDFVTPPDVTEMTTVWGAATLAKAMVEFTRVLPAVATSTGKATRSGREADN